MALEATTRGRRNRVSPSTPEIIDLDSLRSYDKRTIDDDIKILKFTPENIPLRKRKRNFERGESSNSSNIPFVCEICTETKTMKEAFYISGCSHAYCSDCVANYIGSKLEDNVINISCPVPECKGSLEAQFCQNILPVGVSEKWSKALCEALNNVSQKFYCPFPDCSAILINDETKAVRNSECPNCNRMLCAQCKVPWHDGIKCSKFQKFYLFSPWNLLHLIPSCQGILHCALNILLQLGHSEFLKALVSSLIKIAEQSRNEQ
ncbi:unnamed protein product [Lathyrus sativus]|nr:unnamed protein product [Lathyrus sativus]